jgi:hypothetical protein
VLGWLREPFDVCLRAIETAVSGPRPILALAGFAASLVASWFAYVPVHELLHALGCAATGGTVTRLEIEPLYGGTLLARVFPFVFAGGEYAGRLSGFDTHGSDLVYLATDALPYSLTVVLGVPLLRACTLRPRPGLLGPACVLGLAPFYNLPGDYFEMGAIAVTAVLAALGLELRGLRTDDLFRLLEGLFAGPVAADQGGSLAVALAGVVAATVVAVALAVLTWLAGAALARGLNR